ncbi:hypothetical protein H0H93_000322 [Arthromyces matolae]|nr:hypothetical protein H0H93_000322 [Arthromyces matolae]
MLSLDHFVRPARAALSSSAIIRAQGKVVFSGIQPTGVPHLGNYLGALSNWVKLQKNAAPEDELLFSIVGWHALTLPQDPAALALSRRDMLATLLAIGLDPNRSVLFHQDDNPAHTELAWILNCITPIGKLRRMTTWKTRLAASRNANDESEVDESLLNAGLFTYPVLQAADILVYRVLSLRDPTSKMSKSSPDIQSRILLTDTPAQIQSKIRSAVTDSIAGITYDPVERPGTSNLLTILAACTDKNVMDVAATYEGKGHGHLKKDVASAVEEIIKKPREEFERIRHETGFLEEIAKTGASKARERSEVTMQSVRQLLGLHH